MKNIFFSTISLLLFFNSLPFVLSGQPFIAGFIFSEIEPFAETGILLNRGSWDIDEVFSFIGTDDTVWSQETTLEEWVILYDRLKTSEFRPDVDSEDLIFEEESINLIPILDDFSVEVPVAIMYLDANYIEEDSIENFLDSASFSWFFPFHEFEQDTVLEAGTIFSAASLRSYMCTQNVDFKIDSDFLFSNRVEDILSLKIDFGDGDGLVEYGLDDNIVSIHYSSLGKKNITIRLVTNQGVLTSSSEIIIYPDLPPSSRDSVSIITSTTDTLDAYMDVYLGCDGVLDRPVIVVGGFSILGPSNPKNVTQDYVDPGIFERITNQGYDFVAVGFEDTHQSATINAMLVSKIIQAINDLKTGHYDNIVIGESMGGVLTRIALVSMEEEGIDHECRLFVSFDSPHGGSNVPLGLQELLYDAKNGEASSLAGFIIGSIIGGIIDGVFGFTGIIGGGLAGGIILEDYISSRAESAVSGAVQDRLSEGTLDQSIKANDSPFSRELSIRINRYGDSLNPDIFNATYLDFQNYLEDLGFPDASRNVTLFNGSNVAMNQDKADGSDLVLGEDLIERDTNRNTEVFVLVSPTNEDDFIVSRIHRIKNRALADFDEKGRFDFPHHPFDIAPGSYSLDKIRFTFVGTVSAIALDYDLAFSLDGLSYFNENSTNFYQRRPGIIESGASPFDDLYGQAENTKHIKFDDIMPITNSLFEREFMFDYFDLNNRIFRAENVRYFHANEVLSVGREANHWNHPETGKLITPGDVIVEENASVQLTSEGRIVLRPGTVVEHGGRLEVRTVDPIIECDADTPLASRDLAVSLFPYPNIVVEIDEYRSALFSLSNVIPKAENTDYRWEIFGMDEYQSGTGKTLKVDGLPRGRYTVVCHFAEGVRSKSTIFSIGRPSSITSHEDLQPLTDEPNLDVFEIYPNPTNRLIQWTDDHKYNVNIINTVGQIVKSEISVSSVDISALERGAYFIIFYDVEDDRVKHRKTLLIE